MLNTHVKTKLTNKLLVAASILGFGVVTSQANWVYTDVVDGLVFGTTANTFRAATTANDWATNSALGIGLDGNALYRPRNTGPGANAFGATAYTGRYVDSDPIIYTQIGGLTPSTLYYVAVYATYPDNTLTGGSRYGAEFSLDNGATWSLIDNRTNGVNLTWVGTSNGGLGGSSDDLSHVTFNPLTDDSGDSRAYEILPVQVMSDAFGAIRIYMRLPQFLSDGTAQDKFNIDGYALSTTIPEPTTFALLGLGLVAFAVRRRQ